MSRYKYLVFLTVVAIALTAAGRHTEKPLPPFPTLLKSREDIVFSPYTPYSWVSIEALNRGDVEASVIPDEEIREIIAGKQGSLVDQNKCTEFRRTIANPSQYAVPRDRVEAYLGNQRGVLSATIVDEQGGFFYGHPSRLLALKINWFTRNAQQNIPPGDVVLAIAPDVSMAFGDAVICQRFVDAKSEILSIGTNLLFFPAEDLPVNGITSFHSLQHLLVDKQGTPVGATRLVEVLDLEESDQFQQVETYLKQRMGPEILPPDASSVQTSRGVPSS